MIQGLAELERIGGGDGIKSVLAQRPGAALPFEHPLSKIVRHSTDATVLLDRSLAIVAAKLKGYDEWRRRKMDQVWSVDPVVSSSALSELEALGTLLDVLPKSVPVPESARKQTPDFVIPETATVEVYRPRESYPNEERVTAELASQPGPVKISISYPITGDSVEFPANKVVDRILNAKRKSHQTADDLPAVLYVDLRHDWELSGEDVLPYRTKSSKGMQWIGTFGAWHAFYGSEGRRTMLRDRTVLRFLRPTDCHEQRRQGFFREFAHWSMSILAVRDGLVFFENPWASKPLPEQVLKEFLCLHRARPDLSWLRGPETSSAFAQSVESMLDRMEWTFGGAAEPEETEPVTP